MTSNRNNPAVRTSSLQEHIHLLANVDATRSPFLSCYLNLEAGIRVCQDFLEGQATAFRHSLLAAEQVDFDQAMKGIEQWLGKAPPCARGGAVFARGGPDRPYFLAIPLATAAQNRTTYYRYPDIGPLLSMRASREHHLLILLRRRWIQLSEVDANTEKVLFWSALPASIWTGYQATSGDTFVPDQLRVGLSGPLKQIEHLMRTPQKAPLVLAGDADLIEPLRAVLPKPWRARVIDTLFVGAHKTYPHIVRASRYAFERYREERSSEVVARLVRGIRASSFAVAGLVASSQALQRGDVETLVLADDFHCAAIALDGASTVSQEQIKTRQLPGKALYKVPLFNDPYSEMLRLAVQQGVGIDLVHGDEVLHYLGGVGCLLRQHTESQVEYGPKPPARVRLVA